MFSISQSARQDTTSLLSHCISQPDGLTTSFQEVDWMASAGLARIHVKCFKWSIACSRGRKIMIWEHLRSFIWLTRPQSRISYQLLLRQMFPSKVCISSCLLARKHWWLKQESFCCIITATCPPPLHLLLLVDKDMIARLGVDKNSVIRGWNMHFIEKVYPQYGQLFNQDHSDKRHRRKSEALLIKAPLLPVWEAKQAWNWQQPCALENEHLLSPGYPPAHAVWIKEVLSIKPPPPSVAK